MRTDLSLLRPPRFPARRSRARRPKLDTLVLAAFQLARMQGRPAVAEHLLQALEALAADAADGDALAEAYLSVADACQRRG